jgi:hypothetical protein
MAKTISYDDLPHFREAIQKKVEKPEAKGQKRQKLSSPAQLVQPRRETETFPPRETLFPMPSPVLPRRLALRPQKGQRR